MAVRVRINLSPNSRRFSSSLNTGMTTEISGAGVGSLTGRTWSGMAPYLFVPDEDLGNRFLRKAAGDGRPTVSREMVGRASVPADPHACILCGRALHVKREAVFSLKKNHRRVWTGGPKGGAKQAVSRVLSRVAPVMIIPL